MEQEEKKGWRDCSAQAAHIPMRDKLNASIGLFQRIEIAKANIHAHFQRFLLESARG